MCTKSQRNKETTVTEKSFSERVAEAKEQVPAISAVAAREMRERNADTVFIDPRDAAGIAATTGIIPGALNLPLALLGDAAADELPEALASTTRPIVTACQAGPMGALAAHALKMRGYINVHFMDGGTQAWLDAGYVTER